MGHRQGWNFHKALKNRKRRGSCMNQAAIWQAANTRQERFHAPATVYVTQYVTDYPTPMTQDSVASQQ
jgi:hypothetical protein